MIIKMKKKLSKMVKNCTIDIENKFGRHFNRKRVKTRERTGKKNLDKKIFFLKKKLAYFEEEGDKNMAKI